MKLELPTRKLEAEIDGPVGWLIYNNPERRNALSFEMQQAIPAILEHFERNPEIRVVVIRGAGDRAFISGADISEFGSRRATPEQRREFNAAGARVFETLAGLQKPVVAMIRGYCLGAGLATALQADIRIASDDAQFAIPAARLGLGYAFAGVQSLVQIVGPACASEILLSARRFSAEEALRMGLISRVVPAAELEPSVRELAHEIASNAPLTLGAAKAAIRQALRDPAERDLEALDAKILACFESQDYREGQRAFLEKRRPIFRGH